MKVIIQLVPLGQNIRGALAETFANEKKLDIVLLNEATILDFDSNEAEEELQKSFSKAAEVVRSLKEGDEIYVICGGNAFLNALLFTWLYGLTKRDGVNIPVYLLVWERREMRYIIYGVDGKRRMVEDV